MLSALEEIQALNIVGVELLEERNYAEAAAAFSCCLSQLSWSVLTSTITTTMVCPLNTTLLLEQDEDDVDLAPAPGTTATTLLTAPCGDISCGHTAPKSPAASCCPSLRATYASRLVADAAHSDSPHDATIATSASRKSISYCLGTNKDQTKDNNSNRHSSFPSSFSALSVVVYSNQEDVMDPRSEYFSAPFLFEGISDKHQCTFCVNCKTLQQQRQRPIHNHFPCEARSTGTTVTVMEIDDVGFSESEHDDGEVAERDDCWDYSVDDCCSCGDGFTSGVQDNADILDTTNEHAHEEGSSEDGTALLLTSHEHLVLSICCLYNLALCHHLEWEHQPGASTRLLESALELYQLAFSVTHCNVRKSCAQSPSSSFCLTTATTASTSTWAFFDDRQPWFCSPSDTVLKVLMAICTNATHCRIELARDLFKQVQFWNQTLYRILRYGRTKDLYHEEAFATLPPIITHRASTTTRTDDTRTHGTHGNDGYSDETSDNQEQEDDDDSWPLCHEFFCLHAFLNSLPQQVARAA
ncbi:hypothetical protein ACA910_013681 [Epithemia clementina (nom. ined.)]